MKLLVPDYKVLVCHIPKLTQKYFFLMYSSNVFYNPFIVKNTTWISWSLWFTFEIQKLF